MGYLRVYSAAASAPSGEETVFSYYDLEILLPKAGLDANHRVYRAYPGLEYNIRVAAIGGAFPYTFALSNQPSGMTISSNGTISWPNPQASASDITVRVTDYLGTYTEATWSITVGTSGFVFLDAVSGSDSNAGTLAAPFQTLAALRSGGTQQIAYFKAGTYTTAGLTLGSYDGDGLGGNVVWRPDIQRSVIWIAYPGAAPVIDLGCTGVNTGGHFDFNTTCGYLDGLTFWRGNRYHIRHYSNSGTAGFVVRRGTLHGLPLGGDGTNASLVMLTNQDNANPAIGTILQDSTFYDITAVGCVLKQYCTQKLLVEDCVWHTVYEGVHLKGGSGQQFTIRSNDAYDCDNEALGGNMNGNPAFSGEICFNLFRTSPWVLLLGQDGIADEIDVYRNTLLGPIGCRQTTGEGPYRFSHNVIENANGANTPPYFSTYVVMDNDTSTIITHDNLTAASGLVDANGLLVNRALVGTYGHERVS